MLYKYCSNISADIQSVRQREDYSSGSSSGFALGRGLMAGLLATVPVASTTGAGSLKSSAWREKWGLSPIFNDGACCLG